MRFLKNSPISLLSLVAACCLFSAPSVTRAQGKKQKPVPRQTDEVVRVNTELVQTDVTVLDKQGHFVDGLKRGQFELSVDGKPQGIFFFEPVLAQQPAEEEQAGDRATSTSIARSLPSARKSAERGRAGSAMQWLEVPDLAGARFYLSSLFLAERNPTELTEAKLAGAPRSITVNVDHRFMRGSVLRFQTCVYNAERAAAAPDVEMQARIFRNDTALVVSSLARLPTDTTPDLSRLPYWAELALDQLAPGRYILRVTVTDRRTRATAVQEASFNVD